jgi:hypothetical protein
VSYALRRHGVSCREGYNLSYEIPTASIPHSTQGEGRGGGVSVNTRGIFSSDSFDFPYPERCPVDTPVRCAIHPWIATVFQGLTASVEGEGYII